MFTALLRAGSSDSSFVRPLITRMDDRRQNQGKGKGKGGEEECNKTSRPEYESHRTTHTGKQSHFNASTSLPRSHA